MPSPQRASAILQQSHQRPIPLPDRPWIMYQVWRRVLFCSWPIAVENLRSLVPDALDLDLFDGTAWFSLLPMQMYNLHLRFLPPIPGTSSFNEINLRTYVRVNNEPGVYFFNITADSWLGSFAARLLFHLPYRHAAIGFKENAIGDFSMHAHLKDQDVLRVTYKPIGTTEHPAEASLEHFLIERYASYVLDNKGHVLRGDIQHGPWMVQGVEAEFETLTIPEDGGLVPMQPEPFFAYSAETDSLIWAPKRVEGG